MSGQGNRAELGAKASLTRKKLPLAALPPKARLAIPQEEMPSQDPLERARNMEEVALGYTEDQAVVEASRCLGCAAAPCVGGCPVAIDIPGFLAATARADFDAAFEVVGRSSVLPAVCGRVCPQEKQCMAACAVGRAAKDPAKAVAIGRVERFLADRERERRLGAKRGGSVAADRAAARTGRKVAVVGSGPSGLTAAGELARMGHAVTVFEAFHKPGGVAVYGIPEFRLPKAIVEDEVSKLEALGVRIVCDFLVGRTRTVAELMEKDGFEAVYLASGAGLPRFMGIEGEDAVGVFSANELLTRSNLMRAWDRGRAATPLYGARRVAVFGGGNVAMDAARTALRTGSEEVHVLYRRSEAEMPARLEEIAHAKEEGVIFDFLTNPLRILKDEAGRVRGVECLSYRLGEKDASGRARPEPVPGSERVLEVEACIVALGNDSNPLLPQTTPGLAVDSHGHILVDERGATSLPGVFAGGDIVQGAATVILAMGDGRKAARGIRDYLAALS